MDSQSSASVLVVVTALSLVMAACTERYSFCREFLRDQIEEYDGSEEYLEYALVVTFDHETPADVIDEVVERCGGEITSQYPVHYVTVGFEGVNEALSAAACYDFDEHVSVCLPNTSVSYE